jgi:hypothetical protein
MAQFQASLAMQSRGLSPALGRTPSSPPWATAPQPGALQGEAGFVDIGNYGATLPAGF